MQIHGAFQLHRLLLKERQSGGLVFCRGKGTIASLAKFSDNLIVDTQAGERIGEVGCAAEEGAVGVEDGYLIGDL